MKKAFTLAEVLITLGIIGVVAALTLPALITNFQKQALKTQFKKSYSLLTNAMHKVEADLEYIPACFGWISSPYPVTCGQYNEAGGCEYYEVNGQPPPSDTWGSTSECTSVFWPQFLKELKIVKTCNSAADCIPNYKGIDEILDGDYEGPVVDYGKKRIVTGGCTHLKKANLNTNFKNAKILSNGMIILFNNGYVIDIDINGKKGPNKWGYDVFSLRLEREGLQQPKIYRGECTTVEKGGTSPTTLIQDFSK
ncbi:MAG: type II secretion system GspH family protein [Heliobacteriaceae bacterium]|jgi:prepilin-type N-terminal cleavage/methylation domain-containing protein|nr:type II secretion system GspH family protein [Heliobacteriaceae bacterium]